MGALRFLLVILLVAALVGPLVIVGAEWLTIRKGTVQRCSSCGAQSTRGGARYCDRCGARLDDAGVN